ncbi:hypothetical protein PHSC3_001126 [Chlamydiales bacterium STE3]|nr:hypothetical protein PHSC3_001126 [Chlamydiales bacterium STE3]
MFGLENQKKKKKAEPFVFDLEKELMTLKMHKEIKEKVESRIQSIKEVLRVGENKEEFDQMGVMLHGYTSLLKILSRFKPKG